MGFGPTIALRVQVSLMGGQHLVRGSKNDWKNETRDVRCLIAYAEAQMADDISRQNYNLFGEVLAFDATYGTNRYSMIFVPFTGVECHKKCDPTMKQAIATVLTESKHILCMWHVTNKIPVKIKGDSKRNEKIKARVHKLVWNVFIKAETFESRWHDLIEEFNLGDNNWLTDMY
ncbi:protein FAR1-RELATED SEQUENCE 5-like [Bidens hawaiensis]|uniref:protein FAR1-RELATED SEQUENCE 5-like n=1 Tax=Bidens hawaiensis TaxID=980011 RepID=UPI00404A1F16